LIAVFLARGAEGSALIYTNQSDFTNAIVSVPEFTNNFTNLGYVGQLIHPLHSGGTNVGYYITTVPPLNLMVYDGNIATADTNDTILISFVSSNVTAVSGLFYCVDTNDVQVDGTVTLTLSDGTVTNVDSASGGAPQFVGFVSTGLLITSLSLSNSSGAGYPAMMQLCVVPDPPPSIAVSSVKTVTISWPAIPTAYILQSSANVAGPIWSNTRASLHQLSNQVQATVPATTNAAFFRLSHP
jgi:hypothetical protein